MVISNRIKLIALSSITALCMIFILVSCTDSEETLTRNDEPAIDDTATEVGTLSGIIIPWSLDKVIETSDVIVTGTVSKIMPSEEGPLTKDPDRIYIYTDIIITVEKCLLGQTTSDDIAVRIPGGQIGDRIMVSEYDFKFDIGEQVVLYLIEFRTGQPPDGMSMDVVYKLGSSHGKATIQGDTVFNTDKDNTVLSMQELNEKINVIQEQKQG